MAASNFHDFPELGDEPFYEDGMLMHNSNPTKPETVLVDNQSVYNEEMMQHLKNLYRRPSTHNLNGSSSEIGNARSLSAVAVYSSPPEKYLSPEIGRFSGSECSPVSYGRIQEKESSMHSLSANFPSVSLFKEYQNVAMAVIVGKEAGKLRLAGQETKSKGSK
ncbi:hypothetical protein L484_011351 [Morus notabilis]|uniref:Uncharacterized protein n=1 Tax=Morus notabilis TaxID=981085 RepID=W9S8E2_9ROSA|nr:hypothetical protein L484_011351 [Morus notabilis]